MKQRKTQTLTYWQNEFQVHPADIEFIYNHVLEEARIFMLDEIAQIVVQRHCEAEEREMVELQDGKLYQPQEQYEVNDRVFFSQLDYAIGTIEYIRPGKHPTYSDFSVIGVAFEDNKQRREFVAAFNYDHPLNSSGEIGWTDGQGLMAHEEIYQAYGETIRAQVKSALDVAPEFIRFQDQYFLEGLLPEFQEGLFNIADAAIDINAGPLDVDRLIEQMGIVEDGQITDTTRFSVNCRLVGDNRFVDVGPTGQVLWYLRRLQPPEVTVKPPRLQFTPELYDTRDFDEELQLFVETLDDEATDPADILAVEEDTDTINLILNYPHWRSGTLPITPKTEPFFVGSHYNPVLIEFVDGRTGNSFPGWVLQDDKYVFGLAEWYTKNGLPVGSFLSLQRTDDPRQVIIDYQATRSQRDWIRQASVNNNRMVFRMHTEAIGCKYDELMMIGEEDSQKIDELWLKAKENDRSIYDILAEVFPELSKLSPQSTVHAKTLYTAVNMLRRTPPALIFQELLTHECFIDMEHGYWSYDPKKR